MLKTKTIYLLLIAFIYSLFTCSEGVAQECKQLPQFTEYPATDVFKGEPAKPKYIPESLQASRAGYGLSWHEEWKKKWEMELKSGPNFAGHYRVVTSSFGNDSEIIFILDVKTGDVFENQASIDWGNIQPGKGDFFSFIESLGFKDQYRVESRLLIAGSNEEIEFYDWNKQYLRLICTKHQSTNTKHERNSENQNAEGVYTPPRDSEERRAIMNALRTVVKKMSDLDVIFIVRYLKVKDGWAWVETEPRSPDSTNHYEEISGLLHKNGRTAGCKAGRDPPYDAITPAFFHPIPLTITLSIFKKFKRIC